MSAAGVDALFLIIAVCDTFVDGNCERIDAHLADGGTAFEIVLRVEGTDRTRMRLAPPVPEQNLAAIGEKDERHVGLFGIVTALLSGLDGVGGFAFGLDDGQAAPFAAAQHVVSAVAVGQGVFVTNADAVADLPALVAKLGINERAGVGFGG